MIERDGRFLEAGRENETWMRHVMVSLSEVTGHGILAGMGVFVHFGIVNGRAWIQGWGVI